MFCQQCGEQNGPEAKFCFSCGAKLAPSQGQSETVATQHQPPPQTNSEMHLAHTPVGGDEPGETPVATKQSTQGISSNSTRKGIVTFAGIVWFIVALVDFFIAITDYNFHFTLGAGVAMILALLSMFAGIEFITNDRNAMYFSFSACFIAFIFDALDGAYFEVFVVIVLFVISYMAVDQLHK